MLHLIHVLKAGKIKIDVREMNWVCGLVYIAILILIFFTCLLVMIIFWHTIFEKGNAFQKDFKREISLKAAVDGEAYGIVGNGISCGLRRTNRSILLLSSMTLMIL